MLFTIIELLFTAAIAIALFNYVQVNITDDNHWFKYYSKDLALSNNLILAVPNFELYYEFREDHNYSVILDPDRVILLKRSHTKVLPGNSYFSVFGKNDVDIIPSRTDSRNFTIVKKPDELSYESEYSQTTSYKIGLKANTQYYSFFNYNVLTGDCQVTNIGNTLDFYDHIIHVEAISGNKIEYSDPENILAVDPSFQEVNLPYLSIGGTEITEYLYIGIGSTVSSTELNKLKEAILIC